MTSIDDILYILKHEKTAIDAAYNEGPIKTSFKLSPQDFLKYSEADLLSSSEHKYINALSNAKRSLDCQLDTLLVGFGFYKLSKDKNWGFPKKIELLKELGIITPRVLSKINKTRNLMEHEFIAPNSEKVEDFIDIVSLFLAATDNYTFKFMYEKHIWFEVDKEFDFSSLDIIINYENSRIDIETSVYNEKTESIEKSLLEVKFTDEKYKELLKNFCNYSA